MHRCASAVGLWAALLLGTAALSSYADTTQGVSQPQWAEANGVTLRYELSGRGASTVVLLHEIGMTLEGWDELVPMIQSGRRIVRYDLRGFGQSEKIRGKLDLNDEVEDLRALLDRLDIHEPVTLIGGAVGGSIALRFAALHPDRVHALVVVSPIFRLPVATPGAAAVPSAARAPQSDPASLIEAQGIRPYLDERQMEAVYPSSLRTNAARWQRFLGIELSGDPDSRAATLRMATRDGDASRDVAAVRCPTLVVATALFPLGAPARIKADADAIAGAQFEVVQTGHLAALESPELLAPILLRFLKKIGA